MAVLVPVQPALLGAAESFVAAAAGGDTFANDGHTILHAKNASGAPINVTVDSIRLCDQGFDHNAVVAIPAAGERVLGPFPQNRFGPDAAVSYSAAAGLTVAVVKAVA